MKLLTKDIKAKLPKLYSQESNPDPTVVCKFFTPDSNWTWFVTEGSPDCAPDCPAGHTSGCGKDYLLFGMVHGHEKELGYFRLSELESVTGPLGLHIERDLYWKPCPLSEVG